MTYEPTLFGHTPTLSIIIPVYNTEPYLAPALDSILLQNFTDFEIIAINDGSQDRSGEILDCYQKRDPRIRVYHRENSGLSATRNFGFKKAEGAYIYFFDSDDLLLPGALNHLMGLLKGSGSEVIAFSGRYIDEEGNVIKTKKTLRKNEVSEPIPGERLLVKMMQTGIYSPVVSMYIYRKSFLRNNDILFLEEYIHEDEFYTIQVLCMADRAMSVSNIYYEHRIRDGSIMMDKPGIKNVKGWSKAVTQMLSFVDKYPLEQETKSMILTRARELAHNSVRFTQSLQKEERVSLSVDDIFSRSELDVLGFDVRLRSSYPGLFRIYNKVKKIISGR